MSDSTDQQKQPITKEEVKSEKKPTGGLSRRGARGGARGGSTAGPRNDSGPVYRRKDATSAAPDHKNPEDLKQPIGEEETKEKKKLEPVGGRR